MKAMARQRSHSIEFKRQVAQEFIAGESLYALSKRHDISRQLIRVWVEKYEAGGLDEDAQAADLLQEYEAKIAALERMVGRQALEIEFLKEALKNAPRPRSVNTSVIAGPATSPSAGFILLNPDADQLTRDIMPLGKRVQALPGDELLRDLLLELDAVGTLSGHGFHPLKAQLILQNH